MGRGLPSREEAVVSVDFPIPIDKPIFRKLVLDLAKNLLLQKNQIPLQYEAIAKEVELDAIHLAGESEEEDEGEDVPSKLSVKEKQRKSREKKSKAKLVKHGRKLMDDLKLLENVIEGELDQEDVSSINFVFGATPHSGREVYTVEVPDDIQSEASGSSSRVGIHLYRAMMAHDTLQDRLSSRIPVSNIFTVISRRQPTPVSGDNLTHLPEYSLPVTSRCPRVLFRFSFPPPPSLTAIRKLRWNSGPEVESSTNHDQAFPPPAKQSSGTDTDYGRHESGDTMELCTPFTEVRVVPRMARTGARDQDMELCTPAVRWKTPHTELLQSPGQDSMVICTPAVTKLSSRDILCTPSVRSLPSLELRTPAMTSQLSSMELCTPAVSHIKHSLELATPAVSKSPSSMELCTPATNNVVSSMDMCTPPDLETESKVRRVIEDSLDVQTPEMSNLSLESPNKKTKVRHEDLKDSGISSPELSRRATEEHSPILHWFMIDDPIRGFKYKPY